MVLASSPPLQPPLALSPLFQFVIIIIFVFQSQVIPTCSEVWVRRSTPGPQTRPAPEPRPGADDINGKQGPDSLGSRPSRGLCNAASRGGCLAARPALHSEGPLRTWGPDRDLSLVLIQFNILVGPISNFSESKRKRQKGENLGTLRKPWGTRRTG